MGTIHWSLYWLLWDDGQGQETEKAEVVTRSADQSLSCDTAHRSLFNFFSLLSSPPTMYVQGVVWAGEDKEKKYERSELLSVTLSIRKEETPFIRRLMNWAFHFPWTVLFPLQFLCCARITKGTSCRAHERNCIHWSTVSMFGPVKREK